MVKTLYWYWLHYCYSEGLNRSSDRAKEILMFLFHGHYLYRGKKHQSSMPSAEVPCRVATGRFGMNRHRDSYKIFADALDQQPEWETFLDDMGAGTAPVEYNAMVEAVLRQVAVSYTHLTLPTICSV